MNDIRQVDAVDLLRSVLIRVFGRCCCCCFFWRCSWNDMHSSARPYVSYEQRFCWFVRFFRYCCCSIFILDFKFMFIITLRAPVSLYRFVWMHSVGWTLILFLVFFLCFTGRTSLVIFSLKIDWNKHGNPAQLRTFTIKTMMTMAQSHWSIGILNRTKIDQPYLTQQKKDPKTAGSLSRFAFGTLKASFQLNST